MPGRLGLSHVSRHARREDVDELSGRLAGQHGHARVPARLAHVLADWDRDPQRIAVGRRQDERSRRDVAQLAAASDRIGWRSLCRTISAAQLAGEKTKPRATLALVAENAEGLFALTGCAYGAVPRAMRGGDVDAARDALSRLAGIFGERCYVELSDHLDPDDPALCDALAQLASEQGLGAAVTNNVHYARPEGRRLHDVLRCIEGGVTLDEAGNRLKPNGEYWLKDETILRERLGRHAEAFANARAIADACTLDLETIGPGGGRALGSMVGQDRLPGFPVPRGHTAFSYLYALCQEGAREKYGLMTPGVATGLAHELSVIDRCGLAEFFLINWDIVRFCKERRIPAQGRGSAADSIVAYVLDITKVDPIEHELLFERFLTEDSRTMPDIDLDIASNDREDVIQYVYKKYGERYAAMVCNVVTYRARSASREIAKALGFRDETVDRMSRSIDAPRFASRGPEGVPFVAEADVEAPAQRAFADVLND